MQTSLGVFLGLIVALLQAVTYILSRYYYHKTKTGPLTLLAISHIQMCAGAAFILIFIWPRDASLDYAQLILHAAAIALPYFLGQGTFLWTLKSASPSRVTPLLTFKVVVIALESMFFFSTTLGSLRWIGIGLCTLAMLLFNLPEKKGSSILTGLLPALITIIGYANSDLAVSRLGVYLAGQHINHAPLFGTCLAYLFTGLLALCLLPVLKEDPRELRLWKYALPFAAVWLGSIVLLFRTFLLVGPILGTMLQSVRGIISVLLGAVLAHRGFFAIEEKTTQVIFLRRLATTLLMTAGIGIYLLGIG